MRKNGKEKAAGKGFGMGMKRERRGKSRTCHKGNQGFTLVEILVCLAIIVIFCIPLFRGFGFSSRNNFQAHHTQEATVYAQGTLEKIKSMRMNPEKPDKTYEALVALLQETEPSADPPGTPTGSYELNSDSESLTARGQFNTLWGTDNSYDHLFTKINYQQENIEIAGKRYRMKVVLNPLPYSQLSASATSGKVNIAEVSDVNSVDGLKFPVIDTINRYEQDQAILKTLQDKVKSRNGLDVTLKEIYQNLSRQIAVTLDSLPVYSSSGMGQLQVTCDVTYKYENPATKEIFTETYNVSTGIFQLDCGQECATPLSSPLHANFTGWRGGEKIYIFGKPYCDGSLFSGEIPSPIQKDEISIQNNYNGVHSQEGLAVYLVRGNYGREELNFHFSSVRVNGQPYYDYASLSAAEELKGEKRFDKIYLYTNIRGKIGESVDRKVTNLEETIGGKKPMLRTYDVTVTLTEKVGGVYGEKPAVEVTSTKKLM